MRSAFSIFATTILIAQPALGLNVVTDIPVVHSLVAQVMDGIGEPSLLLEQGADAHDFQLRPSQVQALDSADLVVWIGPQMTPWLDRALAATSETDDLPLLANEATILRYHGIQNAHDDHEVVAEAETHDHAPVDPHAWLDPDNAAVWIGLISDALAEHDPGNAVGYRANATLALTRIENLDQTLSEQLSAVGDDAIVVGHDAYGYFAEHFGLTVRGSIAKGDAAEPGAAHLSRMRADLEGGSATCIFPEALTDAAPVATLAEDTPVRIGRPLDPEGRAIMPGPGLYAQLMTDLATSISDCLNDQ